LGSTAPCIKMTQMERDRYQWYLLLLLLGGLALFSYVASSIPLLGPDEPRYSQVARQMFESGDWITPRLGANPWFEKPVLLYWLISLSFRVFGVNEFAARLPSLLASLISSYFIFQFVRRSANSRSGLVSAFLWMTSLFFVAFAQAATFDMLLTCCITAALYFFFYYVRERKLMYLFCLYICCGLGILAKGFVAPILVGLPVVTYAIVSGRWKEILKLRPLTGTLITAAIAAVWFLPVSLLHGVHFWDEFFYQHHVVRYTSSHYHTSGGFFYYIPVLLLGTYPWSFAPLLGVPSDSNEKQELKRFSLCWLFSMLLFFSFSGSKLPGYILPAAPAFFILSGLAVEKFLTNGSKTKRWNLLIFVLNLVLIVALLARFPQYAKQHQSIWLMGIAIAICTIISILLSSSKKSAKLIVYSMIPFLGIFLFIHDFLPESNWIESKELAHAIQPSLTGQRKLLLYNNYDFGVVFYTKGRVDLTPQGYFLNITQAQQLYDYVRQKKEAFVLIGNEELPWIEKFSLWKVKGITRGTERSIVHLVPRNQ
jgi:4-amino-4-deoxy-L-arabinose transferase-like glycosyltransferase